MRFLKYTLAAFLFASLFSISSAQKIGYTNVEMIMAYMPDAIEVQKKVENYRKSLESGIKVKEDYYMTLVQEYSEKAQAQVLTPEKEQEMIEKIKGLEIEIQGAIKESEGKLLSKQMELLKPIQEKLQTTIDNIAKEQNFDYILNQSNSTGVANILYGMDALDISKEIAKRLGITLEE